MTATALQEIDVALPRRRWSRYPLCNPTSNTWFRKLPTHWKIIPLKAALSRNDGGCWGNDPEGGDDETVVLRSTEQTIDGGWEIENPALRKLSAHERLRCRLLAGDLIITKSSGSQLHIGKTSIVNSDIESMKCAYSNFMQRLRCCSSIVVRYLFYLLNSPIGREQFVYLSNSTTGLANLTATMIGNLRVPLPPLDEQRAIAAFLDRETARIDELIAKKQRLIELLKEKRQAVISRAVTKGLDPNAPMKPSGIDWLGDVPKHWDIKPLKYQTLKIGSGKTPKGGAEVYVPNGVMLLRSQNVHDEGMRLEDVVFIDEETDADMANTRVKPGDVLLNITGASIGRCSIASDDLPRANVNQHVCIIRPKRVKAEFLHAILCSKGIKDWIQSQENGTSREGLNFRQIGNLRIAIPPQGEQNEIVGCLRRETSDLDKLMGRVFAAIDKLRQYRSTLITAAVTGQIDVRQYGKEAT